MREAQVLYVYIGSPELTSICVYSSGSLGPTKKKKKKIKFLCLRYPIIARRGRGGTGFFFSLLYSLGFLSAH